MRRTKRYKNMNVKSFTLYISMNSQIYITFSGVKSEAALLRELILRMSDRNKEEGGIEFFGKKTIHLEDNKEIENKQHAIDYAY